MTKILPTLGFCTEDAAHAEQLLSYIYALNNRQQRDVLMLVAAQDAHPELVAKLTIASEIAFKEVIVHKCSWPTIPSNSKWANVNHMFREASAFMAHASKWPFLWLEPDCVPLKSDWLEQIEEGYANTPKRYMGSVLAPKGINDPARALDRVAVYPNTAHLQLATYFDREEPFQFISGDNIVPRSHKSRLFQWLRYTATTERSKVNAEAVLLHGDKEGVLLQMMMAEVMGKTVGAIVSERVFRGLEEKLTRPIPEPAPLNGQVGLPDLGKPPSLRANAKPGKKSEQPVPAT